MPAGYDMCKLSCGADAQKEIDISNHKYIHTRQFLNPIMSMPAGYDMCKLSCGVKAVVCF